MRNNALINILITLNNVLSLGVSKDIFMRSLLEVYTFQVILMSVCLRASTGLFFTFTLTWYLIRFRHIGYVIRLKFRN